MADTSFPARLTARRELDTTGVPILTATVELADEIADLELPAGPAGEQGRRGRPRTTFKKIGEIPNAAARPTGLGAEDRGSWWHRLDDDGMDVWTGTAWQHSPAAVGPRGPIATPNSFTVAPAVHKDNLTEPAVDLDGSGAAQTVKVTVPAGLRGPKGPAGASGRITDSPDYEVTRGPSHGGVFSYDRANRKFRSAPAPLGTGPWSWFQEDFNGEQVVAASRLEGGTFTIPAQPFAWRPLVYGHFYAYSEVSGQQAAEVTVRLTNSQGAIVATTAASAGAWLYMPLLPCYRDGASTRALSPSSDFAVVPAGQTANLVVGVERTNGGGAKIGLHNSGASLVVFAEPVE
ncbi:hypothetical protein [Nocardia huaxiensis]|uniref:Minor tail protein n=1 Tax=Nocardia huaxiensis TaxID=2755382 RepID=A0A7D6VB44_9NOCA|nr:hypothetical protein [Nocardia huaxiensis]QLY30831.1 hypothetical protein H0264_38105 [Nocardia huaxiensis]UFS94333.1 hypothetical protein LPY97_26690 [Nocardia huaxiensis]